MLGHSTDRRVLEHVREVFNDDNVRVLMCFMCACKELSHQGYDKFGDLVQKGNICYRWAHKPTILQTIGGDRDEAAREAWSFNLSAKRFKDTFGAVVAADPGMEENSWEWFRNVERSGRVDRILCCPEDVVRSKKCHHPTHFVCANCKILICNECFELAKQKEKYLGA